jgi:hypothetical protein
MKNLFTIFLLLSVTLFTVSSCSDDEVTPPPVAGGDATVVFGDGGTKATAITNLVVAGVAYNVEIKLAYPSQIFGAYPGTYAFNTNSEAVAATQAINIALNAAGATHVGEAGVAGDEGRYRIGYESFESTIGSGTQENCRFKSGIFEPASWREGAEETNPYNGEPVTWAVFTKK